MPQASTTASKELDTRVGQSGLGLRPAWPPNRTTVEHTCVCVTAALSNIVCKVRYFCDYRTSTTGARRLPQSRQTVPVQKSQPRTRHTRTRHETNTKLKGLSKHTPQRNRNAQAATEKTSICNQKLIMNQVTSKEDAAHRGAVIWGTRTHRQDPPRARPALLPPNHRTPTSLPPSVPVQPPKSPHTTRLYTLSPPGLTHEDSPVAEL